MNQFETLQYLPWGLQACGYIDFIPKLMNHGDTITINGTDVYTYGKDFADIGHQVNSLTDSFAAVINTDISMLPTNTKSNVLGVCRGYAAQAQGARVYIYASEPGLPGNTITLATSNLTGGIVVSGPTLTGGAAAAGTVLEVTGPDLDDTPISINRPVLVGGSIYTVSSTVPVVRDISVTPNGELYLPTLYTDISNDLQVVNLSITAVNNSITSVNTSLTNINTSITNVNTSLTNVNTSLTNVNTSITNLNTSITNLNTSNSAGLSNVVNNITNTNAWLSNVNALTSNINVFTTNINSSLTNVNAFTTNINSSLTNVNALTTNINASLTNVNALTSNINALMSSVNASVSNDATLGQHTMATSRPVVIASDQTPIADAVQVVNAGTITTQNLNPATGVPTAGSYVSVTTTGRTVLAIQVTGVYTGALTARLTLDGVNRVALANCFISGMNSVSSTIGTGSVGFWWIVVEGGGTFYLNAEAAVTGTATVTITACSGGGFTGGVAANMAYIGGGTPSTVSGGGATSKDMGVFLGNGFSNVDYNAQSWAAASGSGSTIAVDSGGYVGYLVALTAWTAGSSTGIDIYEQYSPDSNTWYDEWQCERLSSVTSIFIPAHPLKGRRRFRWVNAGGAATTATVTITAICLSVAVPLELQFFDRTTNLLNGTLNASSVAYDVSGIKNLNVVFQNGAITTGGFYQIQTSIDNSSWAPASPIIQVQASSTQVLQWYAGTTARWARVYNVTAGTTQTINYVGFYGTA